MDASQSSRGIVLTINNGETKRGFVHNKDELIGFINTTLSNPISKEESTQESSDDEQSEEEKSESSNPNVEEKTENKIDRGASLESLYKAMADFYSSEEKSSTFEVSDKNNKSSTCITIERNTDAFTCFFTTKTGTVENTIHPSDQNTFIQAITASFKASKIPEQTNEETSDEEDEEAPQTPIESHRATIDQNPSTLVTEVKMPESPKAETAAGTVVTDPAQAAKLTAIEEVEQFTKELEQLAQEIGEEEEEKKGA